MSERPCKKKKTSEEDTDPIKNVNMDKSDKADFTTDNSVTNEKHMTISDNALPPVIIVNENRSENVDFVIINKSGQGGEKIRFGVEKTLLSLHATFFKDIFDICSNKDNEKVMKEELELIDAFRTNVVFKALRILSGIVDKDTWTIK